jgi:hypothetical protein
VYSPPLFQQEHEANVTRGLEALALSRGTALFYLFVIVQISAGNITQNGLAGIALCIFDQLHAKPKEEGRKKSRTATTEVPKLEA